jgi:hypothetical protein
MMQQETIYTQWKRHRRNVSAPDDFAASVMDEIDHRVIARDETMPDQMIHCTPMMQWGAAAGLIFIGLFRLCHIIVNLLRPQLLMP